MLLQILTPKFWPELEVETLNQPRPTLGLGWRETGRQTIGIGDRLIINIWEPSPDGIFSTAEQRQATLRAVVEDDGKIYVPYIGRIAAVRRSVESLRSAIEQGLVGKAIEPQVQVLVEDNQANAVVVVGDVARPGQQQLPASGLRLLDAVARSGGSRGPAYETIATVSRGGRSQSLRLDDIATSGGQTPGSPPGTMSLSCISRAPSRPSARCASAGLYHSSPGGCRLRRPWPRSADSMTGVPMPAASSCCGSRSARWHDGWWLWARVRVQSTPMVPP